MRVVINAQLDPTTSGGIAHALLGLAYGLGRLTDADEYLFVCTTRSAGWLSPFLGPNQRVVINERRTPPPKRGARTSDGFFESFEPDVLHFPYQSYTRTDIPTVFNPHDLQHVHLPDFFGFEERDRREALYADACRLASAVAVASDAVKRDVASHYGLSDERVRVIPWGPPLALQPRPTQAGVAKVLERLCIEPGFAFYPAQTWPHKNHLRLLQAILRLRDSFGVSIPLVCSGTQTAEYEQLAEFVKEHGLHPQVRFAGRVGDTEVAALYQSAAFLVLPSLCEASSLAILDAFTESLTVACSNLPPLVEQFQEAVLLFEPTDADHIAGAIRRIWEDNGLRQRLAAAGRDRLASFTWDRTAAAYRDLYRAVADSPSAVALEPAGRAS